MAVIAMVEGARNCNLNYQKYSRNTQDKREDTIKLTKVYSQILMKEEWSSGKQNLSTTVYLGLVG